LAPATRVRREIIQLIILVLASVVAFRRATVRDRKEEEIRTRARPCPGAQSRRRRRPECLADVTQDYQILVPLMVANLLSFVISRHYQPVPVYHALLIQDGIHLPAPANRRT
jgi:hypothetical protein